MLARLSSPLVLAWLAFFPLLAWEGGIMGMAGGVDSVSTKSPLPRRLTSPTQNPHPPEPHNVTREADRASLVRTSPQMIGAIPQGAARAADSAGHFPITEGIREDRPSPRSDRADYLEQLRRLGATYLRVERHEQGSTTTFLAHCEAAGALPEGAVRLVARGPSAELALTRLVSQLRTATAPDPSRFSVTSSR